MSFKSRITNPEISSGEGYEEKNKKYIEVVALMSAFKVGGKVTPLDYFVIFVLVLNSSHMSFQGYQDEFLALSCVLMVALALYRRVSFTIWFWLFCVWIFLWVAMIANQFHVWNLNTFLGFYCRIFLAFSAAAILGYRLFGAFESLTYRLTLLSLPLFTVGLILPDLFSLVHKMLSVAPDLFQVDAGWWGRGPKDSLLIYNFWLDRMDQNHGYMWEPTAFASVLLPAIFIRLAFNRFRIDRRLIVLLLGLISTLSTTGFIAASLFLSLFYLFNATRNRRIIALTIVLLLGPVIMAQDFMLQKVVDEIERGDEQKVRSGGSSGLEGFGNSRLSSLIWDMRDFVNHPISGIGFFSENRYSGEQKGGSVNAISDTLVRFGLINSILFLLMYAVTFRRFSRMQNVKAWPLFILMLLTMCVSEGLVMLPLFMAFQFYSLVRHPKFVIQTEANTAVMNWLRRNYGNNNRHQLNPDKAVIR